jgi:hypothetical protein
MYNYLSVGKYCIPAFQITQYNNSYGAYIFDWLITEICSLEKFESIDDWFLFDNLVVVDANGNKSDLGIRVLDTATNILFQHEFPTIELDSVKYIDKNKILEHIPFAKSKFKYLKEKTIKYIIECNDLTLLRVDHSWSSDSDIINDLYLLRSVFSKYNKDIKVQGVGSHDTSIFEDNCFSYRKIHGSQDWQTWGNSQDWVNLFEKKIIK